jgi:alginate O-acetyltransferase complex protein AlgI
MEIISLPFVFLIITSVLIFYLLSHKYRIGYLTLLSCAFIASFNYYLLIYILGYALINFYIGSRITTVKFKKTLFRIGLVINLSQLILLKYALFAIDPILQIFNFNSNISKLAEIIVPIGISYFTLQGLGYLINIKMGWGKPEKKFLNFLLYIVFYPKFLSGPIERSTHFLPQLNANISFNEQQVVTGLRIALFGFFKKIVIANQLGIFVNNVYSDLSAFSGLNLWIIILIQPVYLYFDFSSYTDIAIGFAKMYSIELLPNFDKPFLSQNMTTFWKRFHMSLSFWFNDYVFRQTSFKFRKWGKYASVFGVLITFTLFGIWHGAGWNFMILGFLQALAINYEFFTKKIRMSFFSKMPDFYRIWVGRFFTYIFYGISLVFFFSPDVNTALNYFSKLADLDIRLYLGVPSKIAFVIALFFVLVFLIIEILKTDKTQYFEKVSVYWGTHKLLRLLVYYIVIFIMIFQLGGKVTFIYQMF